MVIFDCNGVLVDSEQLATAIVSQEFMRAGFPLTPDIVAHYFTGRRPPTCSPRWKSPPAQAPANFAATVAATILRRFRAELRATKHVTYALSWLRGPKCVASSSSLDRIRVSLESTDLIRFFEPIRFSGNDVATASRRPICSCTRPPRCASQPRDCIVVEDSPVGVAAGVAAGMTVIGFVGGSHAGTAARSSPARRRRPRRDLRHARAQEHDHRSARVVSGRRPATAAAHLTVGRPAFLFCATGFRFAAGFFFSGCALTAIEADINDIGNRSRCAAPAEGTKFPDRYG